jgi:hypothetical protein
MAPRRKQQAAEPRQQGREVKLRVPEGLMKFIEERAKADGRPINATIVNMMAKVPHLEETGTLADLLYRYQTTLAKAEVTFARYSADIVWQVLSRDLLNAVDGLLGAEKDTAAVLSWIARVRVARAEMLDQLKERAAIPDRTAKR